ncbi:MAG: hypothetical protein AAGE52_42485 [Myxococcota bacterium]
MRLRLFLLFAIACGSSDSTERLDRTGLDLNACGGNTFLSIDGLTPGDPVDYLELRGGLTTSTIGSLCGGASDAAACMDAYNNLLPAGDGWAETPGGGAPPSFAYLVFTRGDEVGVIGTGAVNAFLAPVASAANAAFLAQVQTRGFVACDIPAAQEVPGGFEVITTTTFPCGGAVEDSRVFVGADGETTVLETAVVNRGREEICP